MSSLKLAARMRPRIRGVLGIGMEYRLRRLLARMTPAVHPARDTQFVHCTVPRAASQWVRLVLSDPGLYRYHGHLPYAGRDMRWQRKTGAMLTSQYWHHGNYRHFREANGETRAIFVMRDPRDLVVSWYFSSRYGHDPDPPQIQQRRADLKNMSDEDGLAVTIDAFMDTAMTLWSWANEGPKDPTVRMVRYEDITGAARQAVWREVFAHYGFAVPDAEIARLLNYYALEDLKAAPVNASGVGRYRTARAGGWEEAMSPANRERFMAKHGKLVAALGYG